MLARPALLGRVQRYRKLLWPSNDSGFQGRRAENVRYGSKCEVEDLWSHVRDTADFGRATECENALFTLSEIDRQRREIWRELITRHRVICRNPPYNLKRQSLTDCDQRLVMSAQLQVRCG